MQITFPATPATVSSSIDGRISRLEAALPRNVAGSPLYSNSSSATPARVAVLPSGLISPSTGIAATGSAFPFVVQGQFGFAWAANVLTIYWDGTNGSIPFVIRRSDGTKITIPNGTLAISGLSPSTNYSFAPFVAVAQPSVVSFVAGDSGSPRFAFSPNAPTDSLASASQTQRLTVNESITNGLIYFTTGTATTTTTGGGAASGGGNPYTGQPDSGIPV
jgi:hypothetical protein